MFSCHSLAPSHVDLQKRLSVRVLEIVTVNINIAIPNKCTETTLNPNNVPYDSGNVTFPSSFSPGKHQLDANHINL